MLKKGMRLLMLLSCLAIPVLAHAGSWTLATRVMTVGGSMTVATNNPQTSANGTVFKTYTTSQNVPVRLQAVTGYKISEVKINGLVQPLPLASNPIQMGLAAFPGKTSQGVTVSFAQQLLSITSTAGTGGTVSPSGTSVSLVGTAKIYTFTPSQGLCLVSVTGIPSDAVFTDISVTPNVPVTLPAPPNHTIKASFTVPDTTIPLTLTGMFVGIVAKAGPSQWVFPGSTATLSGSATVYDGSPIESYAWSQTSGPVAGTLTNANAPTAQFSSTTEGTYGLRLVAISSLGSSSTAITNVTVTSTPTTDALNICQNCHTNAGLTGVPYTKWSSSPHAAVPVMCGGCHIGADTGGHPGLAVSSMSNICRNCHADSSGNVPLHPVQIGTLTCTSCHDPHVAAAMRAPSSLPPPHVNTITTGTYPASYVTSQSSCSECHAPLANYPVIRDEWKNSGHANTQAAPWIGQDFKTLSGCVQCHTTTGFLAYSTGKVTAAWGAASDLTKEVLTCRGCHKPDFTVRVLSPYSSSNPYTISTDSTTVLSAPPKSGDYGISNICIPCHYGTTGGALIKQAFTNTAFTNFTAVGRFLNHYRVGAGIMDNTLGYEFDGTPRSNYQDYNKQNTWHAGVSLPGSSINTGDYGPCVTCHLSTGGHDYTAVFKNTTGHIINVTGQVKCDQCHPSQYGGGDQMTAETLNSRKGKFSDALTALKAQLKVGGLDPDSVSEKTWGSTLQQRSNNMGAYYNYFLLRNSDVGAYIHNPTYAKRLIQYSIDWLDDHALNDSVYATLYALSSQNEIDAAIRDSAVAYLGIDTGGTEVNCFMCHRDYYQ